MRSHTSPVTQYPFLLERFLALLPNLANIGAMSSPEAVQKIEQARALIEEARSLVTEKSDADAKELQDLRKQLKDRERELHQKDQQLQRKDSEIRRKDAELKNKAERLEKTKQPVKTFIRDEIKKSYSAVTEAKQAHSQSASKYTAGFLELAKGSHAENEEMFKRLADSVGIDFAALQLEIGTEADEKTSSVQRNDAIEKKASKREPLHLSRYIDRSTTRLARRDSAVAQ